MRHQHTSPFEMCDIKLHVKLPVFVARQWIRHRTASVNEYSGRYSEIADSFYEPEPSAIGRQSALNRQGSAGAVSPEAAERARVAWREGAAQAYEQYQSLLADEDDAVAREVARIGLPRQPLHRVVLEDQPPQPAALPGAAHGQPCPVRDPGYAEAIGSIVAAWVPLTWASFLDHRFGRSACRARPSRRSGARWRGATLPLEEAGMSGGRGARPARALGLEPGARRRPGGRAWSARCDAFAMDP